LHVLEVVSFKGASYRDPSIVYEKRNREMLGTKRESGKVEK